MIALGTPEDRAVAAGEWVLGTLDAADAADVGAALANDTALQRDVHVWQDHLLALTLQALPEDPSPRLWRRIEVAVEALSQRSATPVSAPAIPWWRRARPWQVVGGLALASSAVLAVLLAQRALQPAPAHFLAVLQSPTDRVNGWIVDVQRGGMLRLVPVNGAVAAPAGRSLQFWTKPQGAPAPTSLGLVRAGETTVLPAARLPGVGDQQLFEITLEPENGSPLGRPTGPILFVGRTVPL